MKATSRRVLSTRYREDVLVSQPIPQTSLGRAEEAGHLLEHLCRFSHGELLIARPVSGQVAALQKLAFSAGRLDLLK